MKISKNTLMIVALLVIVGGAGVYFFMRRRKDPLADASTLSGNPYSVLDDQTYKAMRQRLENSNVGTSNMGWILEQTKERYEQGSMHPDYKVSGASTKAGALMSVYASGVSAWSLVGGSDPKSWQEDKQLTIDLYNIFNDFKARAIGDSL